MPASTQCRFSPLLKHPSPALHGAFAPTPKAPVLSPFSSLQDGAQALSTVQDEPQLGCGAVVVPGALPLPGSCWPRAPHSHALLTPNPAAWLCPGLSTSRGGFVLRSLFIYRLGALHAQRKAGPG